MTVSKESSWGPTENYRSENAITQHFAEKNTGVYATFGKLNIFSHGILQIMVNVPWFVSIVVIIVVYTPLKTQNKNKNQLLYQKITCHDGYAMYKAEEHFHLPKIL